MVTKGLALEKEQLFSWQIYKNLIRALKAVQEYFY